VSRSKRKALGEDPLGKRGRRERRYLISKRRLSGEDPYAWIEGKGEKVKKRERQKRTKPIRPRKPSRLKVKKLVKKPKLPAKIWNKLKKVEKGAILLPKEIMAAAKTTGKVTGKITADVSKTIASGVVAGPKEASRIIRRVRSKIKTGAVKSSIEHLFGILGKECYRLIGEKQDILKEKKIKNLIKQIKDYRKKLEKIEEGI